MTITDLYNFCLKNNFQRFNSSENNEEICVQLPATTYFSEEDENIDRDKEGLTPFVAKAYHDHINVNGSEIEPEKLKSTLPSAMIRPILANIIVNEETGEKDFGSHDFEIIEDEDGNEIIKYIEQPIGVIYGDNTIEYDEEAGVNRAILYGYLYNEYCQDAVDIMKRRKSVSCSVELVVREMSFNAQDKVLTLDDFYVRGLTLLNENVKPGMKGSQLELADFCKKENSVFSQNKNIEIQKIFEELAKINDKLFNLPIQKHSEKKGGNENMNKFELLLQKYNKTVEDIKFEYSEMSDSELEAKFEEIFGKENSNENAERKFTITMPNGDVKEYALSLDDISYALFELVNQTYAEADDTYYSVQTYEDGTILMHDYWHGKHYKQNYSRENDNFTLVGDRIEVFCNYLTKEEETSLNELRANYACMEEKLKNYEQAEDTAKKQQLFSSVDFASIAETEEFKALTEESINLTYAEVEKRANAILLDYAKKGTLNFSVINTNNIVTTKKGLPVNNIPKKKDRYGNFFS